jgi:hypothetical protein
MSVYQATFSAAPLDGRLLGDPRVVVNRYTFRGGLVSAMTLTSQDDFPHEVRERIQHGHRSEAEAPGTT